MKAKKVEPPADDPEESASVGECSGEVPPEHARFESLTRRLLAVPKTEVVALLQKQRSKPRTRSKVGRE